MAIFYNPNRKKGLFYIPSGATGGGAILRIEYSAARFCEDGIDPIPGITGDTGGTFSSTTGLVFISTSTGQVDLSASTPGSYVVTYTAPSSDTATTSISIDSIPVVSAGADVAICTGNSTVLTASGATTYSWSTGETTASITVDPTTNTTYTVTGFNGACSATDSVDVTVYPLPTVEITGTLTYCAGLDTTLTATAGLSSYLWSTGATTQSINVTAGSYTVTGTDSNGCSATSSASTVVEYPLPTVSISGTLEFCAGLSTVLTATAGLSSYLWSNGETTQAITVTSGGSYSVTGTDSNGCSNNDSVSVTEHALPTVSISGTLSFCAGANTILTASGASTYLWSTGETTASITVSTGGSYSVTGTDANGCSALDSASVTEYSLPSVSISGTLSYCAGASTTLDAGAGFASYSWSSGETTQTISATAGNYTVTVTDSNGCSNTSAQVSVTELALPNVAISGTLSYCAGSNTTLTATAGLSSYLWSSGETTQSITATAGSYTVTGTDSNGCSNTSSSVTVTETPLDNAGFSYSASSYTQADADPTPTITGLTGGTFSAGSGLVFVDSGTNTGSSTGEIDLSASTIASYTVTYSTSSSGSSVCPNTSIFSLAVTASYSPLLDTYTGAKIAYSLRKLDSNYTGNAIRVRRSSDNSEQDIGFTNNELDTTSLLSFVGSNDGYVTTWYDQSGNTNNATHNNAFNQPLIVSSGVVNTINSKPSIKFNGIVKLNISTNNFGQSNSVPYTILTVSNMTSLPSDTATNGGSHIFGIGSASNGYFTSYGDKIGFAYNGGSPVTNYTSGRPSQQVLQDTNIVSLNSTQLSIYTRGSGTNTLSSNNNTPVTNTQTANPYPYSQASIGASSGNNYAGSGVSPLIGNISECILWWTNFNSDRTDIKDNLNSFYTIY